MSVFLFVYKEQNTVLDGNGNFLFFSSGQHVFPPRVFSVVEGGMSLFRCENLYFPLLHFVLFTESIFLGREMYLVRLAIAISFLLQKRLDCARVATTHTKRLEMYFFRLSIVFSILFFYKNVFPSLRGLLVVTRFLVVTR